MLRKWLIAHDFSGLANRALERAAEQLAALGGGELVLLHVHAPLTSGFGIDLGATTAFQDVDRAVDQEARERLEALAQAFQARHPTLVLKTVVELGSPPDSIVEIAKREDVEQIVVGSHGRRGLERFFLGSVAERVLRMADRSVLVVKSSQEPASR